METVKQIITESDTTLFNTDLSVSLDLETTSIDHLLKMIELFRNQICVHTKTHLQLKSELMDLKIMPRVN